MLNEGLAGNAMPGLPLTQALNVIDKVLSPTSANLICTPNVPVLSPGHLESVMSLCCHLYPVLYCAWLAYLRISDHCTLANSLQNLQGPQKIRQ